MERGEKNMGNIVINSYTDLGFNPFNQMNKNTKEAGDKKSSNIIDGQAFLNKITPQSQNAVDEKKKDVQRMARQLIDDAYKKGKEIQDIEKEMMSQIDMLDKEIEGVNEELNNINKRKEELKAAYGIEEGSPEEEEINALIEKQRSGLLGPEQKEKLQSMGKLTDAQVTMLDLDAGAQEKEEKIATLQRTKEGYAAGLSEIRKENAKSHAMEDAFKAAEKIMEEGNQAIVLMAAKEGIESVEEKEEEAKKEQEKIEEEQEQKEQAQETQTETEKKENNVEAGVKEALGDIDQEEVMKKVKDMVKKANLLMEDLEGMVVDTLV